MEMVFMAIGWGCVETQLIQNGIDVGIGVVIWWNWITFTISGWTIPD